MSARLKFPSVCFSLSSSVVDLFMIFRNAPANSTQYQISRSGVVRKGAVESGVPVASRGSYIVYPEIQGQWAKVIRGGPHDHARVYVTGGFGFRFRRRRDDPTGTKTRHGKTKRSVVV